MATLPAIPTLQATDYGKDGLGSSATLDKFFTVLNPWVQSVVSALGGGISPANLNGEIVSFQVVVPALSWTPFALTSPWANFNGGVGYDTASYLVDSAGIVHLRGTLTTGATAITPSGAGATIATLPSAALPLIGTTAGPINWAWSLWAGATNDSIRLDVLPGGLLQVNTVGAYAISLHAAPQTVLTSLSGLHWPSASGAVSVPSCFPKQVRLVSLSKPRDVIVTSVIDSVQATAPNISVGVPSWVPTGNSPASTNFITFLNIPGLAPGRTYTVRCLVLY